MKNNSKKVNKSIKENSGKLFSTDVTFSLHIIFLVFFDCFVNYLLFFYVFYNMPSCLKYLKINANLYICINYIFRVFLISSHRNCITCLR